MRIRSERSPEPTWPLRSAARASREPLALEVEEPGAQHLHRLGAVGVLGLLRTRHHDAGRQVGDPHGAVGGVDVLPARARGAHGVDADVAGGNVDVDLLGFGQHGDRGGGGVDAPAALGRGHALDAVHAALEFQRREDAAPGDLGDQLLVAAEFGRGLLDHVPAPAARLGELAVHLREVGGEQGGLVAAGAGANLEDGGAFVGRVARQQREAHGLLDLGQRRP